MHQAMTLPLVLDYLLPYKIEMSFCKNFPTVTSLILLLEFFLLVRGESVFAFVDIQSSVTNFINTTINKLPVTFKDSDYRNPSIRFRQGETVFIKIQTSADGSKKLETWFLGSQKERLKELDLKRTGSNPYTYVGNLALNYGAAQYYLSINIAGKETSFSYEQNIEITKGQEISATVTTAKEIYKSEETVEKQKNGIITILLDLITRAVQTIKSVFIKRA